MERILPYLPSRRFLHIIGALIMAIFLIMGAYLVSSKTFFVSKKTPELGKGQTLVLGTVVDTEVDTDGDSLKDWQETLLGTDPRKTDTDGDGTSDTEEIKLGRDPLQRGPNDRKAESPYTITSTAIVQDKNLTKTDILARDFFAKYLEQSQGGQEKLDPLTQQQIASAVLSRSDLALKPRIYSATDLRIQDDSSTSSLKTYGNAMGEILMHYNEPRENELLILQQALEHTDKHNLEKLDGNIADYQTLLTDMTRVSVPRAASGVHLQVMNSLSDMLEILKAFRGVFDDPTAGLLGLKGYPEKIVALSNAYRAVGVFFSSAKIDFSTNEKGYFYAHYVN